MGEVEKTDRAVQAGVADVPAAAGMPAPAGVSAPSGAPAPAARPAAAPASAASLSALRASLSAGRRRWCALCGALLLAVLALAAAVLMLGNTVYDPATVWAVLCGQEVQGASYAIWEVRLPRLACGVLVGFAFGVAGNTFQTMLRNPLASPDVIGITSGASVAAVFCILMLGWGAGQASAVAVAAGLACAALIYGLSCIGGFSAGKLILVGLGVQALTKAVTNYLLLKGAEYDVPAALRWLSGSLSGTSLADAVPLLLTLPLALLVVALGRQLRVLELGDEAAVMLGVRPNLVRAALIVCAVVMVALGTAATGPIACVTFLAGPIASRMLGQQGTAAVPAGLVGVVLVLAADVVGQNFLGTRFPVGVVTGLLGTPYLLYLLVAMNKKGSM